MINVTGGMGVGGYLVQNDTESIGDESGDEVFYMTTEQVGFVLFIWGFTSLSTLYRSYHDG